MRLSELYSKYSQEVKFLKIYIREAHPIDGWWFGKSVMGMLLKLGRLKAATDIYDPKTIAERRYTAGECEEALKYGIRTYVDEMDDEVNKAYAAWPTRLYLVGIDGRIAYGSGKGPFGFKPAEFGSVIKNYLHNAVRIPVI